MRITHLGHACLLVETAGARLLIDPGSYSADFTSVTGLDAVLITHQHSDHADEERVPALLDGNPGVLVITDPDTAELLADFEVASPVQALSGGGTASVGPVRIEGVGERHAFIHDAVPRPANAGYVISADGEPTLFHPGDAYDGVPGRAVDVLALPLNAPWCAVRDTLAFADRIAARWMVPIHDALLNETGRAAYLMHVNRFTRPGSEVQDLTGKPTWTVPA